MYLSTKDLLGVPEVFYIGDMVPGLLLLRDTSAGSKRA